jgi:signal transduction histidine kinase
VFRGSPQPFAGRTWRTGLGLAIVSDCTEALGGSIRCESSAGQGTTFYITLPAANTPEA